MRKPSRSPMAATLLLLSLARAEATSEQAGRFAQLDLREIARDVARRLLEAQAETAIDGILAVCNG